MRRLLGLVHWLFRVRHLPSIMHEPLATTVNMSLFPAPWGNPPSGPHHPDLEQADSRVRGSGPIACCLNAGETRLGEDDRLQLAFIQT